MDINKLPIELHEFVKTFMWGDLKTWKHRLNIVNHLPQHPRETLTDVSSYRSYSNIIDSEDCLFCKKCGEKSLWFALSFYHTMCESCEQYA